MAHTLFYRDISQSRGHNSNEIDILGGIALKRRRFARIWAIALAVLLCGCRPASHTQSQSGVVSQIIATGESSNMFIRRFYNTSAKMQKVLLTIRTLRPKFTSGTDPETLSAPTICITMTCSDGSVKLYRLKDIHYLQEDTGNWMKVNSEKAAQLWQVLWETPSDPEESLTFHRPLPRLRGGWIYPLGRRKFPIISEKKFP